MRRFRVTFIDGYSFVGEADTECEAAAEACLQCGRAPHEVKQVYGLPPLNPLAMSWEQRMAWYDGAAIVLGLTALVVWMHTPPLCECCRCNDAVELCDVHALETDGGAHWDLRPRVELCATCASELSSGGAVVVPHGARPHLLPAELAAERVWS